VNHAAVGVKVARVSLYKVAKDTHFVFIFNLSWSWSETKNIYCSFNKGTVGIKTVDSTEGRVTLLVPMQDRLQEQQNMLVFPVTWQNEMIQYFVKHSLYN
jgi:hypothetical protein